MSGITTCGGTFRNHLIGTDVSQECAHHRPKKAKVAKR